MATKGDQLELHEVRFDIPEGEPSGLSLGDDSTVRGSKMAAEGGPDMPAVDPSGRTPEDILEDLERAIRYEYCDVDTTKQHLKELIKLLQDDGTIGERPAASSALCYAARLGSIPMMESLIQKGVDVNTKSLIIINCWGWRAVPWTPLHVAAYADDVEAVNFLVYKGGDVNIKDEHEKTPLHLAARWGKGDLVGYLADKGADVNIKDENGNTPLHTAAEASNLSAVKYLVDKGADVNSRNYCGRTPCHIALREDIEKYLVDHGADVNMKDGKNVLEHLKKAIQDGDVDSFKQQLSRVEEFFQDRDSTLRGLAAFSALCYAARVGSIPMVDTLIQKGSDVNSKSVIEIDGNKQKSTPLCEAVRSNKLDMVKFLGEKGADVNMKDYGGRSALHLAAKRGYCDTVTYLIDKGPDVNLKDHYGNTALHFAAGKGFHNVVTYLVDKGSADVNIRNDWAVVGNTFAPGM